MYQANNACRGQIELSTWFPCGFLSRLTGCRLAGDAEALDVDRSNISGESGAECLSTDACSRFVMRENRLRRCIGQHVEHTHIDRLAIATRRFLKLNVECLLPNRPIESAVDSGRRKTQASVNLMPDRNKP